MPNFCNKFGKNIFLTDPDLDLWIRVVSRFGSAGSVAALVRMHVLFECDKPKAYILQTRNWLPSSCLAEPVTTITGRQVRLYKSINWWFTGTDAARQQSLSPHANYSHSEKAVIRYSGVHVAYRRKGHVPLHVTPNPVSRNKVVLLMLREISLRIAIWTKI